MKGDDFGNPIGIGVYGNKGIADPANFPGARQDASTWKDNDGNFWLFGGNGLDKNGNKGVLNDLWKYDPRTSQWTWISGGNRINQSGSYGTKGSAAPANMPASRSGSIIWMDNAGKLWLFGGNVFSYADGNSVRLELRNDLWKYDPVSNTWTWISGSDLESQAGVYGIRGTADQANMPGARNQSRGWKDASGNFWLFGGSGKDKNEFGQGSLNDLWKYDLIANKWTWVSGSDTLNQSGVYGTQGLAGSENIPGARNGYITWADNAGNFWLFGGDGVDINGSSGLLNDLWKYDLITNQWTWVAGSDVRNQSGLYGTMGTADDTNTPGARSNSISWKDDLGNLWLFGGNGGRRASLNDLWKYNIITKKWT